ncbi:MAG: CHAD domain-containing protein [Pseudomonadota bacterium]|nr:CHAD domain-containing protein [Pseudomonadota bacterium]MEE3098881.1 CHAD domain-containing protein [Pseudomonadota bacterium]
MTEIELKFLLDEAGDAALRRASALRAMAEGPAKKARLRSIYFDTPDQALRRARIALRLRKVGRGWVQTVKRGSGAGAGLYAVEEDEAPAPGGRLDLGLIADADLRAAVEAAIGEAPLSPVFETLIDRTARILVAEGGRAELALDVGEIVAGGVRAPLREAELELKSGQPAALYAMARGLFDKVPARFSERSKSARGYALAAGEAAVPDPAPRHAAPPPLVPGETCEAAAARMLRDCLGQVDANVACVLAGDGIGGPHQLRVGLRRLRSLFAIFRAELDGPALRALNEAARDIAGEAGRLRDLDVLAEEMLPRAVAAAQTDAAGLAALAAAIEPRREAARAALRARLAAPQTRRFLIDLSAFVELRGWLRPHDYGQTALLARPVEAAARAGLDKRWKKARRAAEGLETLSIEARHELRKELKKLRYGVDFFAPLYAAEAVQPYRKPLKKLQNLFGALNDAAMVEAVLTTSGAPAEADPAAQRAAGRMLGRFESKAEQDWRRAREMWDLLAEAPRFWR